MKRVLTILVCTVLIAPAWAQQAIPEDGNDFHCPDANVFGASLITGICWSCMFPVYLAGIEAFDGRSNRPDGANQNSLCSCGGDLSQGEIPTIGFSVGAYLPSRMVEVVRKPWCFPVLFGADLGDANLMDGALSFGGSGSTENNMGPETRSQYTWHFYAFPLLEIMDLMDLPQCNVDNYSSLDVMFMSEAFPHWYDSELAFLIQPEALIFGNPIAQAAQLADCAAASLGGHGLNEIFWTAGCWGSHYPVTGDTGTGSSVQSASLAASRAMFLLSRLGFLKRTVGSDAVCGGADMPVLQKEQYKFQQIFPVPESTNANPGDNDSPPEINTANAGEAPNATEDDLDITQTSVDQYEVNNVLGGCCHNLGENTMLWGEWRTRPATGQDFVYILWRWTDCCAGILGNGG